MPGTYAQPKRLLNLPGSNSSIASLRLPQLQPLSQGDSNLIDKSMTLLLQLSRHSAPILLAVGSSCPAPTHVIYRERRRTQLGLGKRHHLILVSARSPSSSDPVAQGLQLRRLNCN